jgi:hypothetical protein
MPINLNDFKILTSDINDTKMTNENENWIKIDTDVSFLKFLS